MSAAAESATPPTPPHLNAGEGEAVIPLNTRRTRRAATNHRGGPTSMQQPPGNPPGPEPADPQREEVERAVAEQVEKAFNASGRTLSDDDTAAAYLITLGVVQHTLNGAAANGMIDDEQRNGLAALFAGMTEAPRYV